MEKADQTIYERAEVSERAIWKLREFIRDHPLEVIGHIDSTAACCGNGTVALVKVDLDAIVNPSKR